ncbi:GYF DOMAIN-CONTAINING PROTEIN [Salix koriyanagi]|uniref:GYF DOMAIN-CONTAINING PROTEIN n=1 Tax=Salix koriyanagi TaxID=2511006 RepID=A0A9Q0W0G0_9ROSI|nr:GYF DOMAIN-CONTAINING PROTEIN [Salix koriyanagi]
MGFGVVMLKGAEELTYAVSVTMGPEILSARSFYVHILMPVDEILRVTQGRDVPAMVSKSEAHSDFPMQHAKLLSSLSNNPQQPPPSQNADLISILQGLSDRPASGIENGVSGWSNFRIRLTSSMLRIFHHWFSLGNNRGCSGRTHL